MKRVILILFILAAQFSNAQDKAFSTASSPDGKFSIKHLKDWHATFNSSNILVSLKGSTSNLDNIPVQVALTKEENVLATLTLDDFASRNLLIIKNVLNANVSERGAATINGVEAQWVTYSYDVNERALKGIVYFFIQNGNAYQLVLHCAESDYNSLDPIFKQVAESLVIK